MESGGWIAAVAIVLAIGCAGDDGSSDDTGMSTTVQDGTAGDSIGQTATASAGESTVGNSSSASSSASSSVGADTVGSDDTGSDGDSRGSSSDGSGMPFDCFGTMCTGTQVCVVPCCGGPAPQCLPIPKGEICMASSCVLDDGKEGCTEQCVPDPPTCIETSELECTENSCSRPGGCFGTLTDTTLECECA